jgi:hypothetical protein
VSSRRSQSVRGKHAVRHSASRKNIFVQNDLLGKRIRIFEPRLLWTRERPFLSISRNCAGDKSISRADRMFAPRVGKEGDFDAGHLRPLRQNDNIEARRLG